jgi:flagellar biosynthesis/type III secretory pathway chaperone
MSVQTAAAVEPRCTVRADFMDWLATQLGLLADGLEKKEQALTEIVNITENQNTVLQSGLSVIEAQAFVTQMNKEKQPLIKQVIQCDSMFETVLKEAGPALDALPDSFKPQVAELQIRIRRVMDLDVKIRVCEEKNKTLMEGKRDLETTAETASSAAPSAAQKQTPLPPDANRVINAYVKNTRNYTVK